MLSRGPRSGAAYGKDFILADSAANTLLRITRSWAISTLAPFRRKDLRHRARRRTNRRREGGKVSEYLPLPGAISIEAGTRGTLYAGADFTGPGSIIRVETRKRLRH